MADVYGDGTSARPAHIDDDHPVTLLGTALRSGKVTSSRGIVVRHNGGARGTGPFGVDCCAEGLEFGEALALLEQLQALR